MPLIKPPELGDKPPIIAPDPLPAKVTFRLKRESVWLTKFSVFDGRDNLVYTIGRQRMKYQFFPPNAFGATYEYRPKNFWGLEYRLVDAPVDYVMASFKENKVLDPVGELIGTVENETVPGPASISALFDKGRFQAAMAAFRLRKLVVRDTTAIRFNIDPKGAVDIYVLRPDVRYMSNAIAIAIALRIMTNAARTNSD